MNTSTKAAPSPASTPNTPLPSNGAAGVPSNTPNAGNDAKPQSGMHKVDAKPQDPGAHDAKPQSGMNKVDGKPQDTKAPDAKSHAKMS